jgi:hypothetical protein
MNNQTFCNGFDCPLKDSCYRFTSKYRKPTEYHFITAPYDNGSCDYYTTRTHTKYYVKERLQKSM